MRKSRFFLLLLALILAVLGSQARPAESYPCPNPECETASDCWFSPCAFPICYHYTICGGIGVCRCL